MKRQEVLKTTRVIAKLHKIHKVKEVFIPDSMEFVTRAGKVPANKMLQELLDSSKEATLLTISNTFRIIFPEKYHDFTIDYVRLQTEPAYLKEVIAQYDSEDIEQIKQLMQAIVIQLRKISDTELHRYYLETAARTSQDYNYFSGRLLEMLVEMVRQALERIKWDVVDSYRVAKGIVYY